MATWEVGVRTRVGQNYSSCNGVTTAKANKYIRVQTAYALAYGFGNRDATILQAFAVNTWAENMHIATNTSISPGDACGTPHAFYTQYVSTTTFKYFATASGNTLVGPVTCSDGAAIGTANPAMPSWRYSSPQPWNGLLFSFNHNIAVAVTPITIHFGSGDSVAVKSPNAGMAAMELATSKTSDGWIRVHPTNKLSLTAHNSLLTNHHWWVSLSLLGTSVGFHNEDKVRVDGTYF